MVFCPHGGKGVCLFSLPDGKDGLLSVIHCHLREQSISNTRLAGRAVSSSLSSLMCRL